MFLCAFDMKQVFFQLCSLNITEDTLLQVAVLMLNTQNVCLEFVST